MQIAPSHPTLLLIVGFLLIAGCQGLYNPSDNLKNRRAVEAVESVNNEVQSIKTYQFTINGRIEIRADTDTETIDISGDGIVNMEQQRMNMSVTFIDNTPAGKNHRIAYLEGNTLDLECSKMGWARYNLSESTRWINYTPLGQHLKLLSQTKIYLDGTEEIDGNKTHILRAHPTKKQLLANQILRPGSTDTHNNANIQNATVWVWIDTGTAQLTKSKYQIHLQAAGATAISTVTYHFSYYNKSANIKRPTHQKNAHNRVDKCPGT